VPIPEASFPPRHAAAAISAVFASLLLVTRAPLSEPARANEDGSVKDGSQCGSPPPLLDVARDLQVDVILIALGNGHECVVCLHRRVRSSTVNSMESAIAAAARVAVSARGLSTIRQRLSRGTLAPR
jgi:hypothetical protein